MDLIDIVLWIVFGAFAGWIASIIMRMYASMGAGANIVVGIVGALIGGFIMNALGGEGFTGFNIYSLLVAIGGAIVLLFLVKLFRRAYGLLIISFLYKPWTGQLMLPRPVD